MTVSISHNTEQPYGSLPSRIHVEIICVYRAVRQLRRISGASRTCIILAR